MQSFIGTLIGSEWDKGAEPHFVRPDTMHPLQKALSGPSRHLIQASRVAQEGSVLIFWTVCGHKPSWSPPFPPSTQFSLLLCIVPVALIFSERVQVVPKVCGPACLACCGVSWIKIEPCD